ncbi:MAG: plasmid mobilization relaxosome protein MobC [Lachnospiraceae bacterium]|nr:plasmid mobilization relaxosome protein MobC [Lachnospiraceae bacterium]
MKQAEFLIRCITDKNVINTDGLRELALEVKRVGVNLNQIAHSINSCGFYDHHLFIENQKELREVWQLLKRYLQDRQ